jgi:hypothetical protein
MTLEGGGRQRAAIRSSGDSRVYVIKATIFRTDVSDFAGVQRGVRRGLSRASAMDARQRQRGPRPARAAKRQIEAVSVEPR